MNRLTRLTMLSAVAMLLAMVGAVPAQAAGDDQDYLATGDSVAFGYNPLLPKSPASNFVGYPDVVAQALDEHLTNSSCPGEASGGFISLSGADNGCRPYRTVFPLHVNYSTSQLDFVINFLKGHRHTRLVTIDIGANDLFVLEQSCPATPLPDFIACIQAGLPGLLAQLGVNLDTIYKKIRAVYHHELVALTYYALNYLDPVGTGIISAINAVVDAHTRAWHGNVASGFTAFQLASASSAGNTCAAGLRILLPAPDPTNGDPCDIHPSAKGRDLLANAILQALGREEGNNNGDSGD